MDSNTTPAPNSSVRTQPTLEEELALAYKVINQLITERQSRATGESIPKEIDIDGANA